MPDTHAPPLAVRYASRRALLGAVKTERGALTIFIPTHRVVLQGTPVQLIITFADAEGTFELEGVAASGGRALGRNGVGGFLASFTGDPKRRAAEMVAFCAQRPLAMGTALRERLIIRKNCQLKLADQKLSGELRDLSQTGAFIVGSQFGKIKEGEPVWMKVPSGLLGLGGTWLEARVVWQGKKNEEPGVGLRFTGNQARQASEIQRLLGRGIAVP